ncbi:MAG: TIR domain-containing protein, partial [Promethearchaeota archaeon]
MSSEDDTLICASCGLDLRKSSAIRKNKHNLCPLCTSNGTKEPKFENIVYGLAIGYFMNKKEITDPIEALYSAHTFVSQLPYWQDTVQSPPPLERLNEARMITLGVAQEAEERQLPGFFISYSRTKATQNIVKPLKTALEAYGYRVWDEADKKLIEQTQFCVLILSQTYFTSREGKDELEIILTIKDPKYVFPVWLKDLEDKEMTPLEQEKMEKTKKIMGTGWNEWKGDIEELTNRLVKRAQYALGLQNYNNIPLIAIEAQLLKELEKLVGEPIPFLKKKDLESAKFGFYAEKNRIEGLKLVERRLTSLPSTIGQCLALRTLDLADNDLHTLPESFGNLNNLEELNLHANWLSSLPESFFRLSKLRKVRLAGNQLKTLPPSFRTTHKHLRPQYPAV